MFMAFCPSLKVASFYHNRNHETWIGLRRTSKNDVYRWLDGTAWRDVHGNIIAKFCSQLF